jgi:hypothetical protein
MTPCTQHDDFYLSGIGRIGIMDVKQKTIDLRSIFPSYPGFAENQEMN